MKELTNKEQKGLVKSGLNSLTQHLITSLKSRDSYAVAQHLRQYTEGAGVKYEALLRVPVADRLPALAERYKPRKVIGFIVVMLTDFVNSFNVGKTMTAEQIVNCASDLLITAGEDQLSIEDLAVFFSKAKQGHYGKSYDRIDQAIIFEWLEQYREQRHQVYKSIKEEREAQYKALPVNSRISEMFTSERDKMREAQINHLKSRPGENL